MQLYINNSSKENDIILDPFIGSGTTARTAMLNNRLFLGFEINKNYIEIFAESQHLNDFEIETIESDYLIKDTITE